MKPPTLPVAAIWCGECYAAPGEVHQLSCPEVPPGLVADFLAWQTNPPRPQRPNGNRALVYGLAIVVPLWALAALALLNWSL